MSLPCPTCMRGLPCVRHDSLFAELRDEPETWPDSGQADVDAETAFAAALDALAGAAGRVRREAPGTAAAELGTLLEETIAGARAAPRADRRRGRVVELAPFRARRAGGAR